MRLEESACSLLKTFFMFTSRAFSFHHSATSQNWNQIAINLQQKNKSPVVYGDLEPHAKPPQELQTSLCERPFS